MNLHDFLDSVLNLTPQLSEAIKSACRVQKVKRGELIVKAGKRCNELFYVERGLLRGYYLKEGKEITHWFAKEGEFATSFFSFITNEPSQESIEALEDSTLVVFSNNALTKLYVDFPESERIGRLITEKYYIKLEGRLLGIQFKTAKDRHNNLLASDATLFQRVQLGQIASYLGMTQETLSRIRAEM
jgi:CRP-like cAMP-binding protein